MMTHLRSICTALVLGSALIATTSAALAEWPERPVNMIVPWSAGGGTDATARIISKMLEDELGKPFPVINRTGGGGVAGHTEIANAKPDGYTIGVITTELSMYKHQGVTPLSYADLVPIAQYNSDSPGLIVRADAPYKTTKELLDAIHANPGKLKASGANQGGLLHLAMVGMLKAAGIDPTAVKWVPTQGGAQGLAELTSDGVDFVTNSLSDAKTLVAAGEVRPLATMAPERDSTFRDVPTLKESAGINWTIANWRGIAGPKGLSPEIVAKLGKALEKICQSTEFKSFMDKRGYAVSCLGSETFGKSLAAKQEQFGDAMRAAGLVK